MKNKIVIGVICVAISITIIIVSISAKKGNIDKGNTVNINEETKLNKISFNGIKIGDKIDKKMKNLVMDASFKYEYKNICIDTDKNEEINYLAFFTCTDAKGNKTHSIEEINIEYNNSKLKTISDFKKVLGSEEELEKDDDNKYYIKYYDNDLKLSLLIINDEIYNIVLERNDKSTK